MALTTDQVQTLKEKLEVQKGKLEDVLRSLVNGDPSRNDTRTTDNADVGTEATESNELVMYESLEAETKILLERTTDALARIDQGTYGITEDGEDIPFERLEVEPTATTTVR